MRITIENTDKIVTCSGIECRVWEGQSERGVRVIAFIPRIAARSDQDLSQFEAELRETRAPTAETAAWPLRMIL